MTKETLREILAHLECPITTDKEARKIVLRIVERAIKSTEDQRKVAKEETKA